MKNVWYIRNKKVTCTTISGDALVVTEQETPQKAIRNSNDIQTIQRKTIKYKPVEWIIERKSERLKYWIVATKKDELKRILEHLKRI